MSLGISFCFVRNEVTKEIFLSLEKLNISTKNSKVYVQRKAATKHADSCVNKIKNHTTVLDGVLHNY